MRIDPTALSLQSLGGMQNSVLPSAGTQSAGQGAKSFGQVLSDSLSEVNKAQQHAGDMNTRFAAGEKLDVHDVMIASQEAGVMLSLAVQVRNKVVDGFQEIMRTSM
ncbi:MAG: flagellar hook-basal body complex protein FliE [Armatimonadetes bacterium]|nr:flagellar hook-basal body complex protein FliE [Armatimonadota bacterium]